MRTGDCHRPCHRTEQRNAHEHGRAAPHSLAGQGHIFFHQNMRFCCGRGAGGVGQQGQGELQETRLGAKRGPAAMLPAVATGCFLFRSGSSLQA